MSSTRHQASTRPYPRSVVTEQLPPGPARRKALLARGRNISRRDFTDEEWADMGAQSEAAAEYRRTHAPTPFPDA